MLLSLLNFVLVSRKLSSQPGALACTGLSIAVASRPCHFRARTRMRPRLWACQPWALCVTLRPKMSGPRRKKASLLYGPRDVKFTPQRKEIFLTELRKHGLQHQAAEMAGVHLYTVREHRKNDDVFAAAFDCALGFYREKLEAEIHRRAVDGVDKPVFKNTALANAEPSWEAIGHIREYSDTLLIFHAKRHIAAYRDDDREEDESTGGVLVVPGTMPESEWEKQAKG